MMENKRLRGIVIGTVTGAVAAFPQFLFLSDPFFSGNDFIGSFWPSFSIIVGAVTGLVSARYIKTSSGWYHYFLIPLVLGFLVPILLISLAAEGLLMNLIIAMFVVLLLITVLVVVDRKVPSPLRTRKNLKLDEMDDKDKMNNERAYEGWDFWFLWVLFSSIGGIVGFACADSSYLLIPYYIIYRRKAPGRHANSYVRFRGIVNYSLISSMVVRRNPGSTSIGEGNIT